jgi:hypothetical protein
MYSRVISFVRSTMSVYGLLLLLLATPGWCQFRTVTVQNATSNPVPTSIQNSPTVTISGTPNVNVTNLPAVSGNVTVSNTSSQPVPTKAQGTTAVAGTVTVGNAVGAPVPIRNNDDAGRHPYQIHVNAGMSSGFAVANFTAPSTGELVIEYFSANSASNGGTLRYFDINTTVGGNSADFLIPAISYPPFNANLPNSYLASQQVRLYADSGSTVSVTADGTESAVNFCCVDFYISGYTVAP